MGTRVGRVVHALRAGVDALRRGIAEALREFPEGSFVPTGVYPLGYDGKPPPALVS